MAQAGEVILVIHWERRSTHGSCVWLVAVAGTAVAIPQKKSSMLFVSWLTRVRTT